MEEFAQKVITEYGHVDYLINNALPLMKGIDNCSYEEFNYALKVGVTAPFYLTKLFQPYFSEGAVIVNISSSRDRMSQHSNRKLHRSKRRNFSINSCVGSQPCRKSTSQFNLSGMDRY